MSARPDSTADVWAVGDSGPAVHWGGQGRTRSTVPGTAGGAFSGYAVAGAGAGNAVWAVGRVLLGGGPRPVRLHPTDRKSVV